MKIDFFAILNMSFAEELRKEILARLSYLDNVEILIRQGYCEMNILEDFPGYTFGHNFIIRYAKNQERFSSIVTYQHSTNVDVSELVEKNASMSEITDKVINKVEKYTSVMKSKRLHEAEKCILELQKRVKMLEDMILYMPGGPGYEAAKSDFEKMI